jgi:hypothetical protein
MEKELEVLIPVEVGYECDLCKKGLMYPTGVINQGFEHKCDKCGNTQSFDIKYPTVKYRKMNN